MSVMYDKDNGFHTHGVQITRVIRDVEELIFTKSPHFVLNLCKCCENLRNEILRAKEICPRNNLVLSDPKAFNYVILENVYTLLKETFGYKISEVDNLLASDGRLPAYLANILVTLCVDTTRKDIANRIEKHSCESCVPSVATQES